MLTAFLIWLTGALVFWFISEGFYQGDKDHAPEVIHDPSWRTSHEFLSLLLGSWVAVIIGLFLCISGQISLEWKFPIGKHYIELEKPIAHARLAPLVLAGVGCISLAYRINECCMLMNLSMLITILVLFFAALHPIKTQKQLFWAILAMAGPMILDFILHLTITTSL